MIILLLGPILMAAVLWLLTVCRRSHRAWPVLRKYLYAHRGYHNKPTVPENSMAAFRAAVDRGWGAELDVHLMKDGSLAVIHDSSLLRTAGTDVAVEDLTAAELAAYPLEDSEERIPLLPEVLELFRGKTPLIIELKPVRGNHAALSKAVAELLDSYDGDYCIESFDPRVVRWFRKNRPEVCRGQLAENFLRSETSLPGFMKFLLTGLLLNFGTRPDFIAYKFEDRTCWGMGLCRFLQRPVEVSWTLRNKTDLATAQREGKLVIFEQFDPTE